MTAAALRTAHAEATDPAEREHVTPFLYRRPERFALANMRNDAAARPRGLDGRHGRRSRVRAQRSSTGCDADDGDTFSWREAWSASVGSADAGDDPRRGRARSGRPRAQRVLPRVPQRRRRGAAQPLAPGRSAATSTRAGSRRRIDDPGVRLRVAMSCRVSPSARSASTFAAASARSASRSRPRSGARVSAPRSSKRCSTTSRPIRRWSRSRRRCTSGTRRRCARSRASASRRRRRRRLPAVPARDRSVARPDRSRPDLRCRDASPGGRRGWSRAVRSRSRRTRPRGSITSS